MSTENEEKDEISFEAVVTATNGVQVPLEISVKFPRGYGLYAAKALEAMPNNMEGIYNELVQRQDASVVAVLLANGHELLEDDE